MFLSILSGTEDVQHKPTFGVHTVLFWALGAESSQWPEVETKTCEKLALPMLRKSGQLVKKTQQKEPGLLDVQQNFDGTQPN